MVKLKYQFSRLITSLLSLILVSAVLMLGSPALGHDLSGSTCAADVVFLWDQKHFAGCGTHGGLVNPKAKGQYCGGAASMVRKPDDPEADEHGRVAVGKRPPLLYGHTAAVIGALSPTGASPGWNCSPKRRTDLIASLGLGDRHLYKVMTNTITLRNKGT